MLEKIASEGFTIILTTIVGVLAYLVRSYFERMHRDIRDLRDEINKQAGSREALQKDIRDNTIEMARLSTDVKALWTFIDGSYRRTSDQRRNGI